MSRYRGAATIASVLAAILALTAWRSLELPGSVIALIALALLAALAIFSATTGLASADSSAERLGVLAVAALACMPLATAIAIPPVRHHLRFESEARAVCGLSEPDATAWHLAAEDIVRQKEGLSGTDWRTTYAQIDKIVQTKCPNATPAESPVDASQPSSGGVSQRAMCEALGPTSSIQEAATNCGDMVCAELRSMTSRSALDAFIDHVRLDAHVDTSQVSYLLAMISSQACPDVAAQIRQLPQ